MPSMMSEPHFRGFSRERCYPVDGRLDARHNGIADVANRSLDAFQQIACCLTNLVPVLPQQNADCDCSGDCQNDRAEGAGKNRDYRTDHLDNGDDALYNNKGQLNNGNDRFHNRNNGCNHAKDSRDALDMAMTATTPTAILPMDSPMSVHFSYQPSCSTIP